MAKNQLSPRVTITPENKCSLCKGSTCCTYVTQHLPAPRSMDDFDMLLWQISHQGVSVYKDYEGWFLQFEARCNHLQSDGRCGIYTQRPAICREHSNDFCEFDAAAEEGFDLHFKGYEELLAYCRERFRGWDRRRRTA